MQKNSSNNKNVKGKSVIVNNIVLSKNMSQTADSSEKCMDVKPINESNVQIPIDSYNVLLNCKYKMHCI